MCNIVRPCSRISCFMIQIDFCLSGIKRYLRIKFYGVIKDVVLFEFEVRHYEDNYSFDKNFLNFFSNKSPREYPILKCFGSSSIAAILMKKSFLLLISIILTLAFPAL